MDWVYVLVREVDNIVNTDANKDNDAGRLNNAKLPAKQLDDPQQLEYDGRYAANSNQTDVPVARGHHQNDEGKQTTKHHALQGIGDHCPSEFQPGPVVVGCCEPFVNSFPC